MRRLTVDEIMSWEPCYTRKKIKHLFAGREAITPLEILELPIPVLHIFWAILRPEVLPEKQLRLIACDFAERVLPIWESWALKNAKEHLTKPAWAIEIARRHSEGEADDGELKEAWAAADAASGFAACTNDWSAACASACAYACADAWDYAGAGACASASACSVAWYADMAAAEKRAQIEIVRGYLINGND